jgi:hypothetical protein
LWHEWFLRTPAEFEHRRIPWGIRLRQHTRSRFGAMPVDAGITQFDNYQFVSGKYRPLSRKINRIELVYRNNPP